MGGVNLIMTKSSAQVRLISPFLTWFLSPILMLNLDGTTEKSLLAASSRFGGDLDSHAPGGSGGGATILPVVGMEE
jgi:hypothetical protein